MYALDDSPLFSFQGRHCEELGVAFVPTQYPFVPAQTIPTLTVSGRHGTLRYPGRTFKPRYLKGTLYWLGADGEPVTQHEMLSRASDIALWLCGQDGRGELVLDAMPDRYFVAEVDAETVLRDVDWANGSAAVSFTCQPFARSVRKDSVTMVAQAGTTQSASLSVSGNVQTPLAFRVTNTDGDTMDTLQITAPDTAFFFSTLGLEPGETLSGSYTQDDLLRLSILSVSGAERSAMAMRAPESDDDLMLMPGANAVAVRAQRACSVVLEARGRWL